MNRVNNPYEPLDPDKYRAGEEPPGRYIGTGRNRSYWVNLRRGES